MYLLLLQSCPALQAKRWSTSANSDLPDISSSMSAETRQEELEVSVGSIAASLQLVATQCTYVASKKPGSVQYSRTMCSVSAASQPASRLYIREKQSLSLFYPLRDSPVMPPNRDVGIRAISANRA